MIDAKGAIDRLKSRGQEVVGLEDYRMEEQDECIYYFIYGSGNIVGKYGACFSGIYIIRDRDEIPYMGFYAKKPIIPESDYERWVSFIMNYYNELAGKKLFETTLEDLPWVVVNTDHQYNIVMSALTSIRMVYEQHFYVLLWNRLVEAGVDEVTAWIFTHMCDVTPDDGGRFWLLMKPDRPFSFYVPEKQTVFHTSLHTDYLTCDTVHRMYKRKYNIGRTRMFKDSSGGVDGVHAMFGDGGGTRVIEFIKKIAAGTKGKSNNPFVKEDATKAKKLSLEDTTKFFLSIVSSFEEEFKP